MHARFLSEWSTAEASLLTLLWVRGTLKKRDTLPSGKQRSMVGCRKMDVSGAQDEHEGPSEGGQSLKC